MHNHRSHLKSSFHVVLRYALFSEMCHNNEELSGFKEHIVATLCAKPGTRDEKHLVAVKYDGVVVCYHSSDFTQDIWSMNPESEVFFRWKVLPIRMKLCLITKLCQKWILLSSYLPHRNKKVLNGTLSQFFR